jgi:hypothetical protein
MTPSFDRPRVASAVALTLLEVIRDQDRPTEILDSEDPSVTMPRKLGLSDVVERQIKQYREESRKGGRVTDEEFGDLIRLVIRRPDSPEVFFQTGEMLGGSSARRPRRVFPRRVLYALARRRVKRRLMALFGRRIGGFGAGPFTLEGRSLLFIQNDPGGEACELITGMCQALLDRSLPGKIFVMHTACESRKDALCRWTMHEAEPTVVGGLPDTFSSEPDTFGSEEEE